MYVAFPGGAEVGGVKFPAGAYTVNVVDDYVEAAPNRFFGEEHGARIPFDDFQRLVEKREAFVLISD